MLLQIIMDISHLNYALIITFYRILPKNALIGTDFISKIFWLVLFLQNTKILCLVIDIHLNYFSYPLLVSGEEKYVLPDEKTRKFEMEVQLPKDLVCDQCILQWTYRAGNNWGTDPDGTGCVGCGAQEHFRACADIKVH